MPAPRAAALTFVPPAGADGLWPGQLKDAQLDINDYADVLRAAGKVRRYPFRGLPARTGTEK